MVKTNLLITLIIMTAITSEGFDTRKEYNKFLDTINILIQPNIFPKILKRLPLKCRNISPFKAKSFKRQNLQINLLKLIGLKVKNIKMLAKVDSIAAVKVTFETYKQYPLLYAVVDFRTGKIVGPALIENAKNLELRFFNEEGLEIGPYYTLTWNYILYRDKFGRKFINIHLQNCCESFEILSEKKFAKLKMLSWSSNLNDGFKMTFDGRNAGNSQEIKVPSHIKTDNLTREQSDTLMAGLYAVKVVKELYIPKKSMVSTESYIEDTKKSQRNHYYHEFWNKTLAHDEECREFALIYKAIPGTFNRANLITYPGSGSKWLVEMISFATGFFARSDKPTDGQFSFLQKSHFCDLSDLKMQQSFEGFNRSNADLGLRFGEILGSQGKAVLQMRNPFEAIISWWHHIKTDFLTGELKHVELEESLKSRDFCQFACSEAELWRDLALDWIHLGSDILIVDYEKLKSDPIGETLRVLHFLGMPFEKARIECLRKYPMNKYKRRTKPDQSILCPEAKSAIKRAFEAVNAALIENVLEPLSVQ